MKAVNVIPDKLFSCISCNCIVHCLGCDFGYLVELVVSVAQCLGVKKLYSILSFLELFRHF